MAMSSYSQSVIVANTHNIKFCMSKIVHHSRSHLAILILIFSLDENKTTRQVFHMCFHMSYRRLWSQQKDRTKYFLLQTNFFPLKFAT